MVLKAFFLSSAVGYACQERAIETKAQELGLELTSADEVQIALINVINSVHPEMVDCGSDQGRSVLATAGVAALRRKR